MSYNSKTLLWLLLCFPVGLTRMWRRSCSWRLGAKYAVSSLAILALAAVLLFPEPNVAGQGGVTLYGEDPSVQVYGPNVPDYYVLSDTSSRMPSVIVPEEDLVDTRFFVYARANGKNYHRSNCDYYTDSSKKLTVYEAFFSGYTPCEICVPPQYGGSFT